MKRFLWCLLPLIFIGCGENKQEFYYDYHPSMEIERTWAPQSFPLVIKVPQELEPYQLAIDRSAEVWNEALGQRAVVFIYDQTPNIQWQDPKESLFDDLFGLYKQLSWKFDDVGPTVLAYTGTLSLNGTIQKADLIFNFDNFIFADVEAPPAHTNYVDFQSVLIHELGHFLGLSHVTLSEDSSSVMLPTLRKAEGRRLLSNGDLYRIRNLYLRM